MPNYCYSVNNSVCEYNCGDLSVDFCLDILRKIYYRTNFQKEKPNNLIYSSKLIEYISPVLISSFGVLQRISDINFEILFNYYESQNFNKQSNEYKYYINLKQNLNKYLNEIIIKNIIE